MVTGPFRDLFQTQSFVFQVSSEYIFPSSSKPTYVSSLLHSRIQSIHHMFFSFIVSPYKKKLLLSIFSWKGNEIFYIICNSHKNHPILHSQYFSIHPFLSYVAFSPLYASSLTLLHYTAALATLVHWRSLFFTLRVFCARPRSLCLTVPKALVVPSIPLTITYTNFESLVTTFRSYTKFSNRLTVGIFKCITSTPKLMSNVCATSEYRSRHSSHESDSCTSSSVRFSPISFSFLTISPPATSGVITTIIASIWLLCACSSAYEFFWDTTVFRRPNPFVCVLKVIVLTVLKMMCWNFLAWWLFFKFVDMLISKEVDFYIREKVSSKNFQFCWYRYQLMCRKNCIIKYYV